MFWSLDFQKIDVFAAIVCHILIAVVCHVPLVKFPNLFLVRTVCTRQFDGRFLCSQNIGTWLLCCWRMCFVGLLTLRTLTHLLATLDPSVTKKT